MPKFFARNEGFICEHCTKEVGPIIYGGSYRNHCPFCFWSKHVDSDIPGDRANSCQGMMEPIGVTTKSGGEFSLVHKCTVCGFKRLNRVAGDDAVDLITKISGLAVK